METSELENRWMERKKEVSKKLRRRFILITIFSVIVIGILWWDHVEANSGWADSVFSAVISVLTVVLMILFVCVYTLPPFAEIMKEFFTENESAFYQDEPAICTFEILEMKTNSNSFELLTKNNQGEISRFDVPFSKAKLEGEIGRLRTAVRHTPHLKELPIIVEFSSIISKFGREKKETYWIFS